MAPVPPLVRRLLTAVVVGVATVFVPKTKPDEHWSTPPTVTREEETPGSRSGGPPPARR